MAAVEPEAAFGPAIPAKKIANATGTVTTTASQVVPLTSVPMISARLPVTARPVCAMSLSFLVPPNPAMTSVAKPPNVANSAICGSPTTLSVSANNDGTTTVARAARGAAGTDQTGFHQGCAALLHPTDPLAGEATPLTAWLRAQQRGDRRAQRRHAGFRVRPGGAQIVARRLGHLQVSLNLRLGAAGADGHPAA